MKPDLSVEVCGVKFKNPIVVASATPSKDAAYMKKCADAGAGGIIAKTVTYEPKLHKYVSPRFTVLQKRGWPHSFSNYSCEFLANYTPEEWYEEMKAAAKYCHEHNVVLVGSISGGSLEEWAKLAADMESTGVDMLELNFGCPHPRDLGYKSGQELGSDPEAAAEVVETVVNAVKIPVFVKLTAEAVDPLIVARKVQAKGASGLTVINRFPALEIDMETGRPILHSTFAGVNGPWMRPIMLKWVAKIAREIDIPISATNGIWEWQDVVKSIMVGASTVQTCTALMYSPRGYKKIGDFVQGLEKFMDAKGYRTIAEMRGITLGKILTWDKVDRETKAVSIVDKERCTGCKMCQNWCFYGAISYEGENGKVKANISDRCDGCGLCASLCPRDAIHMEGPVPVFLGDFS
ncbi:NAD-dependent dihydropyrimidine dehydrogenase subunit PreA [Pelotomaculum schinkii]|uniref:Dihydroorotate dehydrogenase B (NAD(+)), catalytic subunit n=1 Tax=Pelotomaculum schinkii TaxID=78350 RepID=A0A4Y7R765_9FIRM|nr:tRNA-dihydrouridine synthase [Pelotomaculum schinkii]TEB04460.1 NAD-dependent dihydropyrimidine dehydrogenase subunit PreA [Pelotomaculum schinkii]